MDEDVSSSEEARRSFKFNQSTASDKPQLQVVHSGHIPTYANYARSIVEGRARIEAFFEAALFSDPAFDLLLHLFADYEEETASSIERCIATLRVPETTANRWIGRLVDSGLVEREISARNNSKADLRLTPSAHQNMMRYLAEISSIPLRREILKHQP